MMSPTVSSEFERMWAAGRSVCDDDLGRARIGDVDAGEVLRRALVREPQDAAAVLGDLDRHALAHAAEAVELVVGQQLEVLADGLVRALCRRGHVRPPLIVNV